MAMSEAEIKEIEERAEAATEEPWVMEVHRKQLPGDSLPSGFLVCQAGAVYDHALFFSAEDKGEGKANAEFSTKARTDIPNLIAEVRRLQAENAKLRKVANQKEWRFGIIEFHCEKNEDLRRQFFHVVEDLQMSASIMDIWLNDIQQTLRQFGYDMRIYLKEDTPREAGFGDVHR